MLREHGELCLRVRNGDAGLDPLRLKLRVDPSSFCSLMRWNQKRICERVKACWVGPTVAGLASLISRIRRHSPMKQMKQLSPHRGDN